LAERSFRVALDVLRGGESGLALRALVEDLHGGGGAPPVPGRRGSSSRLWELGFALGPRCEACTAYLCCCRLLRECELAEAALLREQPRKEPVRGERQSQSQSLHGRHRELLERLCMLWSLVLRMQVHTATDQRLLVASIPSFPFAYSSRRVALFRVLNTVVEAYSVFPWVSMFPR
jgi:hypothetical protein